MLLLSNAAVFTNPLGRISRQSVDVPPIQLRDSPRGSGMQCYRYVAITLRGRNTILTYTSYSQRNACIGSIAVARRAGIYPANAATAAMPSEAAVIVSKSVG
jgi:hypothetical protein